MAKQRQYSSRFKAQRVLEILSGAKSLAQVSREHKLDEALLQRWQAQFVESGKLALGGQPRPEDKHAERAAELERQAAKLRLQLEIAEKLKSYLESLPPDSESWTKPD